VPEGVSKAQLCVTQQLDQPLPVWALHKLGNGVRLAAVDGVWGDVQVPAQALQRRSFARVGCGSLIMRPFICGHAVHQGRAQAGHMRHPPHLAAVQPLAREHCKAAMCHVEQLDTASNSVIALILLSHPACGTAPQTAVTDVGGNSPNHNDCPALRHPLADTPLQHLQGTQHGRHIHVTSQTPSPVHVLAQGKAVAISCTCTDQRATAPSAATLIGLCSNCYQLV
jgi:hypothetical protein